LGLAAGLALAPAVALAWGDEGHEITAMIAYDHLRPRAKAKVDALLAADGDTLTAPDFASRATWADKYRAGHRETADWHFVDIEIDAPDLSAACFGFPGVPVGQAASNGPAEDCVIDKIEQFKAELADPSTPQAEQILALKFLMHFVGDIHQPLHASDHQDKGGNCIAINPVEGTRSNNLHAWWDTGVLQPLGSSAVDVAARLGREITPMQVTKWSRGNVRAWAQESFALAKAVTYQLPAEPICAMPATISLSAAYQASAREAVITQLEKAGVRMAYVINQTLDR
jgi:hypothetical protein